MDVVDEEQPRRTVKLQLLIAKFGVIGDAGDDLRVLLIFQEHRHILELEQRITKPVGLLLVEVLDVKGNCQRI